MEELSVGRGTPIIRVVCVDDNEAVRSVMEVFIAAYDDLKLVGTAANGEEAVHICSETGPNVVLMDVMMPVMDGITATRLIREQSPQTQIIVLSSYSDIETVAGAMGAGAYMHLSKNVSTGQLVEAIRAAYGARCASPSYPRIAGVLHGHRTTMQH